jgi:predicted permease
LPARTLEPAATFPNTGNLGLPIAQLAFGETGLAVTVAFFAVSSLVQHTLGVWVMSKDNIRSQPWPKGVMFACVLAVVLRAANVAAPAPVL